MTSAPNQRIPLHRSKCSFNYVNLYNRYGHVQDRYLFNAQSKDNSLTAFKRIMTLNKMHESDLEIGSNKKTDFGPNTNMQVVAIENVAESCDKSKHLNQLCLRIDSMCLWKIERKGQS